METITLNTQKRSEFIDITPEISRVIAKEKIEYGICIIFCPHTTAGLTINENADPAVRADILKHLDRAIPESGGYRHLEGNSDAHIKASLVGGSLNIIVRGAEMILGKWQGVYFCEFDGPRSRKVYVECVNGAPNSKNTECT